MVRDKFVALYALLILPLLGCGGRDGTDWESSLTCSNIDGVNNGRVSISFEDEGKGSLVVGFGAQVALCERCEIDWEEVDGKVKIDTKVPCPAVFEMECQRDDDDLSCNLPDGRVIDYRKVD